MPSKKTPGSDIVEQAHRIWLAGLGSLALAEEQGSKLMTTLVEHGRALEHQLSRPAGRAGAHVRGTVRDLKSRTNRTLESLESVFDARIASVLSRLGLPTRDDLAELNARVEQLTAALDGEQKRAKTARKTSRTKTAAAGTKTKKTARKKPSRGKAAKRS